MEAITDCELKGKIISNGLSFLQILNQNFVNGNMTRYSLFINEEYFVSTLTTVLINILYNGYFRRVLIFITITGWLSLPSVLVRSSVTKLLSTYWTLRISISCMLLYNIVGHLPVVRCVNLTPSFFIVDVSQHNILEPHCELLRWFTLFQRWANDSSRTLVWELQCDGYHLDFRSNLHVIEYHCANNCSYVSTCNILVKHTIDSTRCFFLPSILSLHTSSIVKWNVSPTQFPFNSLL